MACLGPCQPALTQSQIAALWIANGGNPAQAQTAAAIAMAESGGVPNALGDSGDSVGLWQVDTAFHPGLSKVDLTNPNFNAQQAINISGNGGNWTPWSTYCSSGNGVNCVNPGGGAYRKYLGGNTLAGPTPGGQAPTDYWGDIENDITNGLGAFATGVEDIAGGIFNDVGSFFQALFGGNVSPFLRLPQSLINIGWNFGGFCIGLLLILIGGLLIAFASFEDIADGIAKVADNMGNNQQPGTLPVQPAAPAAEAAEAAI
jgi:hypothetical protein